MTSPDIKPQPTLDLRGLLGKRVSGTGYLFKGTHTGEVVGWVARSPFTSLFIICEKTGRILSINLEAGGDTAVIASDAGQAAETTKAPG